MPVERKQENPVRLLICPNAFKGSLTAVQAARAMTEGARRALPSSDLQIVSLPVADGGDGTLEALTTGTGGSRVETWVHDPLGKSIPAFWGRLGGERSDTAVIEMAQASGIRLLSEQEYDPRRASTFGTGELMRAAMEAGCTTLLIGIGGSATNDGGVGMAQALGARFLDRAGNELPSGGAALKHLHRIDTSRMFLPPNIRVIVACDVDNPLCGPEGASAVYGPQKGATPDMVRELEGALSHYAAVLKEQRNVDVLQVPGGGAAGGLGAGMIAFCHAALRPGTEMVLDAVGFDQAVQGSRLVLTGEGKLDGQTARGKVIAGVARRAQAAGVPVVALAGALEKDDEKLIQRLGLVSAFSIVPGPMASDEAMRDAYRLLDATAERVVRLAALCW